MCDRSDVTVGMNEEGRTPHAIVWSHGDPGRARGLHLSGGHVGHVEPTASVHPSPDGRADTRAGCTLQGLLAADGQAPEDRRGRQASALRKGGQRAPRPSALRDHAGRHGVRNTCRGLCHAPCRGLPLPGSADNREHPQRAAGRQVARADGPGRARVLGHVRL